MMTKSEMVKELAYLQIMLVRWTERNTSKKFKTYREIDRLITGNRYTQTYGEGILQLEKGYASCTNQSLIELVQKLKENILNSELKDVRFGLSPHRPFSDEEHELTRLLLTTYLSLMSCLDTIGNVAEQLNISPETIKKAAQEERLLNTKKTGKTWEVELAEVRNLGIKPYFKKGEDKNADGILEEGKS